MTTEMTATCTTDYRPVVTKHGERMQIKSASRKIDFYFYIYRQILTKEKEIDHIVVKRERDRTGTLFKRDYNNGGENRNTGNGARTRSRNRKRLC